MGLPPAEADRLLENAGPCQSSASFTVDAQDGTGILQGPVSRQSAIIAGLG
jgi:hypothetical protein